MSTKDIEKYKVISLFAGCGGLDLGFIGGFSFFGKTYEHRKFQIEWANDIDEHACHTYRKNFNKDAVCGSIVDILNGNYAVPPDRKMPTNVDVVLGGFPCQDFSHAGKRKGFNSERGRLYQSMIEVIDRTRPLVFVAENVKGLLTMGRGQAIQTIMEDFSKLGYDVRCKLFNVADYGVPQTRERVVIIGTIRSKLPAFENENFPKPTHEGKWIKLSEAIGDLENKGEGDLPNHFWSKAKKNTGQGNNTVSPDKPGPTMRAEHHGNIEFHWNGERRLSAREAARIQSFPDDFIFYPSTSSAYRQIGNAVPPVMAWHIAKSIEIFLEKNLN
jgi:DNA (cytosine-5)-methyltransferase 1